MVRRSGPRMAHEIRRQSREPLLLISGCRLGLGGTVPPGGVALHLRYHAGGVRRQGAAAGPRVVCRMQRPATDEPRPPADRCGAAAAPVSADLSLTCDVPAVDLSRTSRDGTADGERSKGPVTCAVLMAPASDGPVPHTSEPPVQGGALARERRARVTRMYEGTNQTQRVVMARPPQCPVRSG